MSTLHEPQPTQTGQETEPIATPEAEAAAWAPPEGPPLSGPGEIPPPPVLATAEAPQLPTETPTPPESHARVSRRRGVLFAGLAALGVGGAGVLAGTQLGGGEDDGERTVAEAPPSSDFEATDPGEGSVVTTEPGESSTETTADTPDTTVASPETGSELNIPMLEEHSRNPNQESVFIQPNDRLYPAPNQEIADLITDDPQVLMERTLHNIEAIVNYENEFAYNLLFPRGEPDPENGVRGTMEDIAQTHLLEGNYWKYYIGRLADYDFQDDIGQRRLLIEFFIYDTRGLGQQVNFILTFAQDFEPDGSSRWSLVGGWENTDFYSLEETAQNP